MTGGATGLASATIWGAVEPWVDFMMFAFKVFIGFCLSASIYIPLIPFIIFMGQVLNWLLTVIEGVCAAPFLAFAHLDTDGEGLGHKTQYGYTFALTSFMRPVMLVLGFVVASVLIEAICMFLMRIYPVVISGIQADSVTGIVSIMGFIVLFFTISIGLITSAASVMYILPDAIFSFMGASSSATSQAGRDVERGVSDTATAGVAAGTQVPVKNLKNDKVVQKKLASFGQGGGQKNHDEVVRGKREAR